MIKEVYVIFDEYGEPFRVTESWDTAESILTEHPDYTVNLVRMV